MGGGLMQLVAYGAQDVYLTGNPQITFWKVTYRRHTNFAMESIEQTFNGQADFGRRVTCTISRNGDLAYRTYLQVTLPEINQQMLPAQLQNQPGCGVYARWLDFPGHQLISMVEVEIGGQRIDRQYGDWMHIWNQLCLTSEQQRGYYKMVGNTTQLTFITDPNFAPVDGPCATTAPPQVCAPRNALQETTLYIPFQFWYCRNPGLALPLIALQYHEIRINLDLRPIDECLWAVTNLTSCTVSPTKVATAYQQSLVAASLYVDYVFLDTDERRRMAQNPHEYLIEQLQFTGDESVGSSSNKIKLNFNHPCKELIWVVQPDANVDYCASLICGTPLFDVLGAQPFNYTDAIDSLPNAIHAFGGPAATSSLGEWGGKGTGFITSSGAFQDAGADDLHMGYPWGYARVNMANLAGNVLVNSVETSSLELNVQPYDANTSVSTQSKCDLVHHFSNPADYTKTLAHMTEAGLGNGCSQTDNSPLGVPWSNDPNDPPNVIQAEAGNSMGIPVGSKVQVHGLFAKLEARRAARKQEREDKDNALGKSSSGGLLGKIVKFTFHHSKRKNAQGGFHRFRGISHIVGGLIGADVVEHHQKVVGQQGHHGKKILGELVGAAIGATAVGTVAHVLETGGELAGGLLHKVGHFFRHHHTNNDPDIPPIPGASCPNTGGGINSEHAAVVGALNNEDSDNDDPTPGHAEITPEATHEQPDEHANAANTIGSSVSDAGTFVLNETSLEMHCWGENPVVTAKLQLNGQDRFSEREGTYFDLVQPYQHHTRNPDTGINVYSFALRPEEHQPSGTCNFSRIDNATLQLVLSNATVGGTNTAKVRVYATNYNVLRIMSGMGGLAYSN